MSTYWVPEAAGAAIAEPHVVAPRSFRYTVIDDVLDMLGQVSVMLAGEAWAVAFNCTAARSEGLCANEVEVTSKARDSRTVWIFIFALVVVHHRLLKASVVFRDQSAS